MSALDARIRRLAREEAESLTGAAPAAALESSGPDRVAELEKEVADLRARLEKLETGTTLKRAPRKTTDSST